MEKIIVALLLGFFLSGCTTSQPKTTGAAPSPTQVPYDLGGPAPQKPGALIMEPITINLNEASKSGQMGTVLLQDYGDKTRVTLTVTSGVKKTPQPAHIHTGKCEDGYGVAYPLNDVVDGKSDTIVGTTMSSLFAVDMSVNVHKSVDEAEVVTMCGDIKNGTK